MEGSGSVQVISKDMIQHSSQTQTQTPPHPRELKLSYIDKMLAYLYIPLIFLYEADESRGLASSTHLRIVQRLKQSLLRTLPSFYPLSGRLQNQALVNCNDAGVEFVDARARGHLKNIVALSMDHDQLKQYVPWFCTVFDHGRRRPHPLLAVQITRFDCGGLAVGVCISHAVADLASAMVFVNAWAAACRGEKEEETSAQAQAQARISFGTTNYFPSLGFLPIPYSWLQSRLFSNENFTTKRFVFDKKMLESLREIATSSSQSSEPAINDPSRVELVSAFIWKHFMAARLKKGKPRMMKYAAMHAVNVRTRTGTPRMLENVFGNCAMFATASVSGVEAEDCIHMQEQELIGRLRRSIRRVRDEYITKPLNKESFMKDIFKLVALIMMGKVECCVFTSWRGFPLYELDYGWGKPTWFATPSMPMKNLIVLVSSKSGDDVEAIVTMIPDDLQILDAQINLISSN